MADNIFSKMMAASGAYLDAQLAKAQYQIEDLRKSAKGDTDESDFNFGKAVTRDRTAYTGSQGYQEKSGALTYDYQKQMAIKSSILSAIIKTRQNQVASHSPYMPEGNKPGFKIKLKHEQDELEEIMLELFGDPEAESTDKFAHAQTGDQPEAQGDEKEQQSTEAAAEIKKASGVDELDDDTLNNLDAATANQPDATQPGTGQTPPKEVGPTEEEKRRKARKELDKRTKKKKKAISTFLLNCGELKDRPFESKRWTLDGFLRAIVWDTLCFDFIACEMVPKQAEKLFGKLNIHHFTPVDGSTIRYASPELSKYKTFDAQMTADVLYPEDELMALERRDALELDDDRLAEHAYKYVQVVRGRIVRAFTEDELKIGMRNPVTDIYANCYSISEMELLVALITSHLQTEYYNRSYFQQGFSAKGILHVKANLNRAKLEDLRRNWNHMVKGNRNSFQTPIMSGMDEIQWIPLTQNHSEMEFSLWLNYLIRMICSIFQTDPAEIGYGMKDVGGAGMSGDNTKEKLGQSKDKGFRPLMKFLQDWINTNIIDNLDPDYMLEWTGLDEETETDRVTRQGLEVKFKKTVNELRAEDGLPPINGADQLILDPVFFQWWSQFSEEGKANQQQMQQQMATQPPPGEQGTQEPSHQQQWESDQAGAENDHRRAIEGKLLDHELGKQKMQKSEAPHQLKIEYYKVN